MNPAIFIPSHPNTEEKNSILMECISSVKKSGFPIILTSNVDLPKNICDLSDGFVIGKNEECRYLDFLSPEEIDSARNSSVYLSHFLPQEGESISYDLFSYGRGSTYHWSASSHQLHALKYAKENRISHIFFLEGDIILDEKDVHIISEKFYQMEKEKIDFIITMNPMAYQISGNAWFITTVYLEKICKEMSPFHFLKTTYPDFSAERYLMKRMEKSGGSGTILFGSLGYLEDKNFSCYWELVEVKTQCIDSPSVNLLFPNTKKIGLSSSTDRKDQDPSDPLTYVSLGVGERSGTPLFFIRNRYNGITVKQVKAKISIFNGDSLIFHSDYNLVPGGWAWNPVHNLERNSHCTVDITVVDHGGNEFYYSDRFGYVGDSTSMRKIIPE